MSDQPAPTDAPEPDAQKLAEPEPDAPEPDAPEPDAQKPDEPEPAPANPPTPTPTREELDRIAVPATLRRAPQYRAFAVTGIAVGLIAALALIVAGTLMREIPPSLLLGLVLVIGLGGVGALLGLGVALLLEGRSPARRPGR